MLWPCTCTVLVENTYLTVYLVFLHAIYLDVRIDIQFSGASFHLLWHVLALGVPCLEKGGNSHGHCDLATPFPNIFTLT